MAADMSSWNHVAELLKERYGDLFGEELQRSNHLMELIRPASDAWQGARMMVPNPRMHAVIADAAHRVQQEGVGIPDSPFDIEAIHRWSQELALFGKTHTTLDLSPPSDELQAFDAALDAALKEIA